MHALKYICDSFEIKHTIFFYSCMFDVQCTIVSDSFFTSILNGYRVFLFIVAMETKNYIKPQSKSNIWCKFHIDPSLESLLNGQLEMLGMVQKEKLY